MVDKSGRQIQTGDVVLVCTRLPSMKCRSVTGLLSRPC